MADNEPLLFSPDREPEGMSISGDDPAWQTWHSVPAQPRELLGDRYLLEEEIGYGASSITYHGLDQRLDRPARADL
jgi:hypothetical protein